MEKEIIENEEVKEEKQEMVVASFGSLANSSKWNFKGDMGLSYVQLDLRS